MIDDRFKWAEDQFFILKGQLSTGHITQQQFEAALESLMVQDASGRWWRLFPTNDRWHIYNGSAWVEANPENVVAGAAPPPIPPVYPTAPKKSGIGCCGIGGCALLGILLLVVLAAATIYFRIPQQLGLIQSPAEKVLSDTPDRGAASLFIEELQAAGTNVNGISAYVFPYKDDSGSLLYVILDVQKGFTLQGGSKDLIFNLFKQMVNTETVKQCGIKRIAIEYINASGASPLTMTASVSAIALYASGSMPREEFLKQVEGKVDWAAFYQGLGTE